MLGKCSNECVQILISMWDCHIIAVKPAYFNHLMNGPRESGGDPGHDSYAEWLR